MELKKHRMHTLEIQRTVLNLSIKIKNNIILNPKNLKIRPPITPKQAKIPIIVLITTKAESKNTKNKDIIAKSNMEYLIVRKYRKIIKILMLIRYSIKIQY